MSSLIKLGLHMKYSLFDLPSVFARSQYPYTTPE